MIEKNQITFTVVADQNISQKIHDQATPTSVSPSSSSRTSNGLIVPANFVDRTNLTDEGLIIPAVINSEPEEKTQTSPESACESPQSTEFTEDESENTNVHYRHLHAAPLSTPSPHQISLSLHEKPDAITQCDFCTVDEVNFSMLSFSADDIGNADRFLAKFGDVLRYNYEICKFLLWNGLVWEATHPLIVKNMCEAAMKSYRKVASYYKNSRNYEDSEIYAHSCMSCNNSRLNALVEILKERLAVSSEIFDSYDYLLTVRNGIVNLKTGELFAHSKKLYLTSYIDVDFKPDANFCNSLFKTFLSSICCDNIELINFLQNCFGYAITGETNEQKIFLLHGLGANGKTTLIEAIGGVISSYAKHLPIEVLTGLSDNRSGAKPSPELAQTPNIRTLFTSEPNAGSCLNEGLVKLLTGGGKITVRHLYGAPFEFEPKFKIFIDTNHLPSISGEQFSMQRRLCVIPFMATFKGSSIDRYLPEKLKSQPEKEVILAWLIDGAIRYYREGLTVPPSIASVTSEYVQLNDSLSRFLSECVKKHDGAVCFASTLFAAYSTFCNENGIKPVTQTAFGRNLAIKGIEKDRNSHGVYYKNIQVI